MKKIWKIILAVAIILILFWIGYHVALSFFGQMDIEKMNPKYLPSSSN